MTFAKPTSKNQDSGFDEMQRLMCSVDGCPNRWNVHLDGDKPKCSFHQWQKTDYPKPSVQKSITQTIRHWNETEDF